MKNKELIMRASLSGMEVCAQAQTRVTGLLQGWLEGDCHIEGGNPLSNDESTLYYNDGRYA